MTVFIANEISGLSSPSYNSGAANKGYVDSVSGSVVTWADGQFYLSSMGYGLSGSYNTHKSDEDGHHTAFIGIQDQYANTISPEDTGDTIIFSGQGGTIVSGNTNTLYVSSSTAGGSTTVDGLTDTNINSAASGHILMYSGSNWANIMPPMNFNIANVRISAQQNINLTRFTCPAGKQVHIWQAAACNSGGTSIADLYIECLSGTTSVYKTSSSTLQEGNPLGVATGGNIEVRFMYSGGSASGIQYGTGFMNISVY
jgi:hypothetical protein